jgi:hypothetical protein
VTGTVSLLSGQPIVRACQTYTFLFLKYFYTNFNYLSY